MPDSPSFSWDRESLRYRDSRGRFLPEREIRRAADAVSAAAKAELKTLAERYVAGRASLGKLEERAREIIRDASVGAAAVAAGGRKQATSATWGRVGRQLRDRYAELAAILAKVASGEIPKDGALVNAISNLGGSATRSYEAVRRDLMATGGYTEERRRRDSGNSCGPCVEYEGEGWVPVGTLPDIGDACECHSNCRCGFEHRLRRKPEATVGTAPPEFGPSRATVKHTDYTEKEVLRAAKTTFGRDVTLQEIASASGAPHDATVEIAPSGSGHSLDVFIRGPGYTMQREVVRTVISDQTIIKNHSFFVDESHQGKGIGSEAFGRQVEQAARLGVSRLDTHAAGRHDDPTVVGSKVWPRMGYDGKVPVGAILDAKEQRGDPIPQGAEKLSDLMKTKEGRQWWDRNRRDVDLSFDLKDGSLSRRAWDSYRQEKVAKAPAK